MGTVLSGISRTATVSWLNASALALCVFGIAVALGLAGEIISERHEKYRHTTPPRWPIQWKSLYRLCEIIVIVGVVGELIGDGGIFIFSGRLQTLDEAIIAQLNSETVHLESLLVARDIGDHERELIKLTCERFKGKSIQLQSYLMDVEGLRLALELDAIFRSVGMKVDDVAVGKLVPAGWPLLGMQVEGPKAEEDMVITLHDMLAGQNLGMMPPQPFTAPGTPVVMLIGVRPLIVRTRAP